MCSSQTIHILNHRFSSDFLLRFSWSDSLFSTDFNRSTFSTFFNFFQPFSTFFQLLSTFFNLQISAGQVLPDIAILFYNSRNYKQNMVYCYQWYSSIYGSKEATVLTCFILDIYTTTSSVEWEGTWCIDFWESYQVRWKVERWWCASRTYDKTVEKGWKRLKIKFKQV